MGNTAFRCAVDKEMSRIVKYFVEEIKVDITLYDQVIIIIKLGQLRTNGPSIDSCIYYC